MEELGADWSRGGQKTSLEKGERARAHTHGRAHPQQSDMNARGASVHLISLVSAANGICVSDWTVSQEVTDGSKTCPFHTPAQLPASTTEVEEESGWLQTQVSNSRYRRLLLISLLYNNV